LAAAFDSAARRDGGDGDGAASSNFSVADFSMILIRDKALFCGRKDFDSVSRTMSCLGA
jgi:hypothetical protein